MTMRITNIKKILPIIVGAALLLSLACSTPVTPASLTVVPGAIQPDSLVEASGAPVQPSALRGVSIDQQTGTGFSPTFAAQATSETGIRVSGRGQASGIPDLAILNVGVEAFAATVVQARSQAASAMEDMLAVLLDNNIPEEDIQTRFFNISPRYTSREITRCIDNDGPINIFPEPGAGDGIKPPIRDCFPERQRVITGYQVSNQLSIKVRDLDEVGRIIDQVVEASGNLVRFQGINFTIEDTKALEELARVAAVEDLTNKAKQLAELTGVTLGTLVSIVETSGGSPLRAEFAEVRGLSLAADVATPILPGEQNVTVTVQGLFAIQ